MDCPSRYPDLPEQHEADFLSNRISKKPHFEELTQYFLKGLTVAFKRRSRVLKYLAAQKETDEIRCSEKTLVLSFIPPVSTYVSFCKCGIIPCFSTDVAMMDSAASASDAASSLTSISNERTVRLGAAHDDAKDIGLLFSKPQTQRDTVKAPPLFQDFYDTAPANAAPSSEATPQAKARSSWLDALSNQDHNGFAADRPSTFNPDENGLYRMFLPETV
ncbi:hypothetical protein [Allorhizobium terrae]|uniref:Uncharacterized protein n=1 Tax=Allorhizobium terrae TaxID=1848972 RepID=A0A4S3ZTB6_9HYPH|nr:hypothetical protein [Allorhizobium terrae]THF48941.1 hypothetical protein E6C51_13745 [Allorhizobium terrae]